VNSTLKTLQTAQPAIASGPGVQRGLAVEVRRLVARMGARYLECEAAPCRVSGGVVSFTFDDVPRSGVINGAAILDHCRVQGTFYIAGGRLGAESSAGPLCSREEVSALAASGHEIGCHTWSHLDCTLASGATLEHEIEANRRVIEGITCGRPPTSFAYPYGHVSRRTKRALKGCFRTCRGTDRGVNEGRVDLANLRANQLYSRSFDWTAARALIDRTVDYGGWVIFYTHDVSDAPSPFGCTPAQLEAILYYAVSRSCIRAIRDAVEGVTGG
jgi:peptidoglycan/xylan/chitin deacetylase (PgdA/CDA1 family)